MRPQRQHPTGVFGILKMIELIFIFYIIPKRLYPLAREQGKSGLAWSVIGAVAFVGGEFVGGFLLGFIYALIALVAGYPMEPSGVFTLLAYVVALVSGFAAVHLVQRHLEKANRAQPYQPAPPDPPTFN